MHTVCCVLVRFLLHLSEEIPNRCQPDMRQRSMPSFHVC
jgi:hypothetical protein